MEILSFNTWYIELSKRIFEKKQRRERRLELFKDKAAKFRFRKVNKSKNKANNFGKKKNKSRNIYSNNYFKRPVIKYACRNKE